MKFSARRYLTVITFLLGGIAIAAAQIAPTPAPATAEPVKPTIQADRTSLYTTDPVGHIYAEFETDKGLIEVELDFKRAPLTTMNFIGLAEGTLPFQNRPAGKPFYDGQTFHRVVEAFVIQGGDPSSADPAFPADKLGEGGPGYSFPDEFSPGLRHDAAGVLSMANDGPDTNGSQFFITLAPVNRLNYLHSVFGQVVRGLEVVKQIAQCDKIRRVMIRRVGPEAEAFRPNAESFGTLKDAVLGKRPAPTAKELVYLTDETKQLPDFRVKNFNYKLANYERTSGHRIVVRVLPEFKAGPDGDKIASAVKKFAAAAGITDQGSGVMACTYVAEKSWTLRLGEATFPALLGTEGSTEELMAKGILHERKSALTDDAVGLLKQDKLKESVDSMIDTLILKLDDSVLRQKPAEAAK